MNRTKRNLKIAAWNIVLWVVSYFGLLLVFSKSESIRYLDYIYTLLFHLPLLLGVVWNQYSMHKWLDEQKLKIYVVSFFVALLLIIVSYPLVFDVIAPFIFPDLYFVTVYEWFEILGIGLVYIGLSLLLHLSKNWTKLKEKEAELAKIQEEKTKSELKALRAQINPHFLFNSLNAIYGESIKKSDKAPEMVLMLSDILRYVVENMNKQQISVKEELAYIEKYIALQKLRLNNPEKVNLSVKGNLKDLFISPLLLINFVENTFKHGDVANLKHPAIFNFEFSNNELFFTAKNAKKCPNKLNKEIDSNSGMGLINTKTRLEHSYPSKHTLTIDENDESFQVKLKMELS